MATLLDGVASSSFWLASGARIADKWGQTLSFASLNPLLRLGWEEQIMSSLAAPRKAPVNLWSWSLPWGLVGCPPICERTFLVNRCIR